VEEQEETRPAHAATAHIKVLGLIGGVGEEELQEQQPPHTATMAFVLSEFRLSWSSRLEVAGDY